MRSEKTEIKIQGMICRACTDAVEEALIRTRGVIDVKVSYIKSLAAVEYDPNVTSAAALEAAIRAAGYEIGARSASADIICAAAAAALTVFLLVSPLNAVPAMADGMSLGYIFMIGLFTSTHCAAMCGGIMLGAASRAPRSSPMLYNGGRIISYTMLGAVFGALGTVISYDVSTKSMIFTMLGLLVLLIGLNMWGIVPGLRALSPTQGGLCALPKNLRERAGGSALIVGLLTGLMPCGALNAMWLYAMGTGSASGGALVMLFFALGTVPLMLAFGLLGSFMPKRYYKYMVKAGAVLVVSMGAKMLINGLKLLH